MIGSTTGTRGKKLGLKSQTPQRGQTPNKPRDRSTVFLERCYFLEVDGSACGSSQQTLPAFRQLPGQLCPGKYHYVRSHQGVSKGKMASVPSPPKVHQILTRLALSVQHFAQKSYLSRTLMIAKTKPIYFSTSPDRI